jgi:distribution and morphology protein 34
VLSQSQQANPLNHKQPDIHLMAGSRGMLAAKDPLVVPMLLRLSHFRLSSYVVLVVSKQKGITLVFKTDPLQHVDINSTFDSIAVIQNFIQREIEGQLRQMFREDLPGIIHRLSQQWVKAKVEAPYLNKRPSPPTTRHTFDSFVQTPNISDIGLRRLSMNSLPSRRPLSTSGSRHSTRKSSSPTSHSETPSSSSSSHPDLENFDPTYGLRPEGLPSKSGFKGFSNLFTPNKGLADLAEESSDFDEYDDENDERGSFDLVDWEDAIPGISPTPSVYTTNDRESPPEYVYETIPAVGGGTITRPRIYHSQSTIQSAPSLTIPRHPSSGAISYFPDVPTAGPSKRNPVYNTMKTTSFRSSPLHHSDRPTSPDSTESQHSRSSSGPSRTLSTDLTDHQDVILGHGERGEEERSIDYMRRPPSERRFSVTSTSNLDSRTGSSSPPDRHFIDRQLRQHSSPSHPSSLHQQDPTKIVLRLSLNSSIHQLSTLSHSNHTLSPYTRDVSHFTVRSVPPRGHGHGVGFTGGQGQGFERQPSVKAKRKRMYRLGKGGPPMVVNNPAAAALPGNSNCPLQHNDSISPTLPAEFDVSDMDRYFRSYDDLLRSPNLTPTIATIRRRTTLESSGQRV